MSDLADALGWYSVPVPALAVEATAEIVTRLPLMPPSVDWIHSVRKPVLMKTDRARKQLALEARAHGEGDAGQTMAQAQRAEPGGALERSRGTARS